MEMGAKGGRDVEPQSGRFRDSWSLAARCP